MARAHKMIYSRGPMVDRGQPAYARAGMPAPDYEPTQDGIKLREYYAARALAGLLASCANPSCPARPTPARAAYEAFQYADAMLIEGRRNYTATTDRAPGAADAPPDLP